MGHGISFLVSIQFIASWSDSQIANVGSAMVQLPTLDQWMNNLLSNFVKGPILIFTFQCERVGGVYPKQYGCFRGLLRVLGRDQDIRNNIVTKKYFVTVDQVRQQPNVYM